MLRLLGKIPCNAVPDQREAELQELIHIALAELLAHLDQHLPPAGSQAAAPPSDAERAARAKLRQVTDDLARTLAADDFACQHLVEEHEALLRSALGPRFAELKQAMDTFDFAAALRVLQQAGLQDGA